MPARRRHWPLPGTRRVLPKEGTPGSFWEDRGDRSHAGVDLYAPPGSPVAAIEGGRVVSAGAFTSPGEVPYWNRTCEVTIAHASGFFCRYAELGSIAVAEGDPVQGGDVIGQVGEVLNLSLIRPDAPPYIRALKDQGHASMLHLELYRSAPGPSSAYRGGNWFSRQRPAHLLDPGPVLRDIS